MRQPKSGSEISLAVPAKSARAFFFDRVIRIGELERDYCLRCIGEAQKALREELQSCQADDPCEMLNPLTHYILFLEEVLAGRRIRYYDLLDSAGVSAAFLGHRRILELISEAGCDLTSLAWSGAYLDEMTILGYAIKGHRFALAKRLMKRYPALAQPHPSRPDVVAWCAQYGTPRMLDFLRAAGYRMDRSYYWKEGRGFLGTPMWIAVKNSRKAIVRNLLAHGEIGVGTVDESKMFSASPLWREALENQMEEMVEVCRRRGDVGEQELCAARKQLDDNAVSDWRRDEKRETIAGLKKDLRHWMRMDTPDMVVFSLCEHPEILSLVSEAEIRRIRSFISATGGQIFSGADYLLRYAHAKGVELFANDEERMAFWSRLTSEGQNEVRPHLESLGWSKPCRDGLASAPRQERGFCPDRFEDECLDERDRKIYVAAAVATGSIAKTYLDDPEFNPNRKISFWEPFSSLLMESVDWRTVRRWLLRGMRIYYDNFDDPGMVPIYGSKETLRHLTGELQMRPWLSREYCGNSLCQAAAIGDLVGVKLQLDLGCPVNFRAGHCTALRVALMHGHDRIARYLYVRGGINMDVQGRAFPVPDWIVRRAEVFRPRTVQWKGRRVKTIPVDLLTELPRPLAEVRRKWLNMAKMLNGNVCNLLPSADRIAISFDGGFYDFFPESFGLDRDAFSSQLDDIERDFVDLGCELI